MNNLSMNLFLTLFTFWIMVVLILPFKSNGQVNKNNPLLDSVKTVSTDDTYRPIGNWITDDLVEIKIRIHAYNYRFFYYDTHRELMSNEYHFVIAVDSLNFRLACLDTNKIQFYDIFLDSLLLDYHLDGIEPIKFLYSCWPKAFFDIKDNFHLKYDCRKEISEIRNSKDSLIVILNKER